MGEHSKRALASAEVVARRVRESGVLCRQVKYPGHQHEKSKYWIEPGGKRVAQKGAEVAIELGLLVPNNDGLFGDLFGNEFSQTYRAP
jgi:hypothetical protein